MARDAAELLSERLGIETQYIDQAGTAHVSPAETLRGLWGALGPGDEEPAAALRRLEEETAHQAVDPVQVVSADQPLALTVRPPPHASAVQWEFVAETGEGQRGEIALDGSQRLTLPVRPALGYHRLVLRWSGVPAESETAVIAVPKRAYEPPALRAGRAWGITAQLYGLRSARNWGIGDFTDLAALIEGAAPAGAAAIGVNPLHALFLDQPERASPYSPSSRLFLNPLYIDVTAVPDFPEAGLDTGGLDRLREAPLVDYAGVAARKRAAFEALYASFHRRHLRQLTSGRSGEFREFQREGGAPLRRFAIFQVLRETLSANDPALRMWRDWPERFRAADRPEVDAFAVQHQDRVEFFEYLQWLADRQLGNVAARTARAGMAIGLYRDLAVGVDADSADAWAAPALAADGWSIGAPPDAWNRKGQDWGLLPPLPQRLRAHAYASFVAMLRANMRHAGALRIDHILGLRRLFWVPRGASPAEGAYVHYPFEELLGIIALESVRNRCLVIGEDLGTVPSGFSETLQRRAIYSYRLLYFETDRHGRFKPPSRWPKAALASVSTHDLPTFAGFWSGSDITVKQGLGLYGDPAQADADRQKRGKARQAIAKALADEGLATDTNGPPIESVHRLLGRTRSRLVMAQVEDLLGVVEQANVPGTIAEHPNWRRKLPVGVERLFDGPAVRRRCAALAEERPRAKRARVRPVDAVPRATYRLQLNQEFGFTAATEVLPYLRRLGVSHVYVSPILEAQRGSPHGYDATSFERLNPELGPPESFERFTAALRHEGLKLIVDFVPNHMGIGKAQNAWWLDLLEWGSESAYAKVFDIDWNPPWPELRGKVLVPILGDPYGDVLERGELQLRFDATGGGFDAWYHEHRLPISPRDFTIITSDVPGLSLPTDPHARKAGLARSDTATRTALTAAAERFNRPPFQSLHDLLERQSYRLASWRAAGSRANYRRFFDVNELAGIRMDRPEVFAATHGLLRRLIEQGHVQGLRIDHVDGLRDPELYCRQLRRLVERAAGAAAKDFTIVVEKILATHERLRDTWPVDGTTGYEFIDLVNALLVDGEGLRALAAVYQDFVGESVGFASLLRAAKGQVIDELFSGGLTALAVRLGGIAGRHWSSRELDADRLRAALREVVVAFPVYRTYVTARGLERWDRREIDWTIRQVRRRAKDVDPALLTFIHQALTGGLADKSPNYRRSDIAAFVLAFQQFTAPIMAKAYEDTAFYRYLRLLSLNEVGGSPHRGGASITAFHRRVEENQRQWPRSMLTTATHDTKRGEDARARLHILSERPELWRERCLIWRSLNQTGNAPDPADEYMLYQTLVGAWPNDWLQRAPPPVALREFHERIGHYLVKAMREGKRNTSWLRPDEAYEQGCLAFVGRILASEAFLESLREFSATIARFGALNGLVQVALKLTLPGVPDTYRGCELWDHNLVDPDNRRPVDMDLRRRSLDEIEAMVGLAGGRQAEARHAIVSKWHDGRVKLWLIRQLLALRVERPALFAQGNYAPLPVEGPQARHVVAFIRRRGPELMVAVVGRHFTSLAPSNANDGLNPPRSAWGDTVIVLPGDLPPAMRSALTGDRYQPDNRRLPVGALFEELPTAVLLAAGD